MRSMTGYGKGTAAKDGRSLTIEMKTVNNRYLDINSRVPKVFAFCDEILRKMIPQYLKRGSVEILFNYEDQSNEKKALSLDLVLAEEYVRAARKLRDAFLLEDDFHVSSLLRSPDVLKPAAALDESEVFAKLTEQCGAKALASLNAMRETEGATIQADLVYLVGNITDALHSVVLRAPKVVEEYRQKITQRVCEILQGVEVDQTRLLSEVAFFADKCDIHEEISRLRSHIDQFLKCLKSDEPQGRKLDFLAQEMNREINTMGSKSSDIELTNWVIAMKNELEKIKEQIRNVE